jgi:hypothetical protein
MAGMSISWRAASRPAAVLAIVIAAIPLLPHLLRTPEPPAPDPSVGLPTAEVYAPVAGRDRAGAGQLRRVDREIGHRARADDGRERAKGHRDGAEKEDRSTAPEPRPEASGGEPASPVVAEVPTSASAVTPVAAPPAPVPAPAPQPEPAPPSPSAPPEPAIDQEFGP